MQQIQESITLVLSLIVVFTAAIPNGITSSSVQLANQTSAESTTGKTIVIDEDNTKI
jgi:hypothetical protein